MKLDKNSLHRKLFTFYYHWKPNNEGCHYFRHLILMIVLFPINIVGVLFYKVLRSSHMYELEKENPDRKPTIFRSLLLYPLSTMAVLGLGTGIGRLSVEAIIHWGHTLSILACIPVAILVYWFTGYVGRASERAANSNAVRNAKEVIKSFKDGICPTIEWVEK